MIKVLTRQRSIPLSRTAPLASSEASHSFGPQSSPALLSRFSVVCFSRHSAPVGRSRPLI